MLGAKEPSATMGKRKPTEAQKIRETVSTFIENII